MKCKDGGKKTKVNSAKRDKEREKKSQIGFYSTRRSSELSDFCRNPHTELTGGNLRQIEKMEL